MSPLNPRRNLTPRWSPTKGRIRDRSILQVVRANEPRHLHIRAIFHALPELHSIPSTVPAPKKGRRSNLRCFRKRSSTLEFKEFSSVSTVLHSDDIRVLIFHQKRLEVHHALNSSRFALHPFNVSNVTVQHSRLASILDCQAAEAFDQSCQLLHCRTSSGTSELNDFHSDSTSPNPQQYILVRGQILHIRFRLPKPSHM